MLLQLKTLMPLLRLSIQLVNKLTKKDNNKDRRNARDHIVIVLMGPILNILWRNFHFLVISFKWATRDQAHMDTQIKVAVMASIEWAWGKMELWITLFKTICQSKAMDWINSRLYLTNRTIGIGFKWGMNLEEPWQQKRTKMTFNHHLNCRNNPIYQLVITKSQK